MGNLRWIHLRKQREQKEKINKFYRENKTDFFIWGCVIFGLTFLLIVGIATGGSL